MTANTAPLASIDAPAAGARYNAGDVIAYSARDWMRRDGSLPATAFTWWVDFHHDAHVHPFLPEATGSNSGSFRAPSQGDEKAATVWYRIYLRVRDSHGLTRTVFRDVVPNVVALSLGSSPPALQLNLDGQPTTMPYAFDSVVGMLWTVEAPSPQVLDGVEYTFRSWSDGGAASHEIATPSASASLQASFAVCKTASREEGKRWNTPWPPAAGASTVSVEWDVTPGRDDVQARLGLSLGPASRVDDLVAAIRFEPDGSLQAKDGPRFRVTQPVSYRANATYRVRMQSTWRASATPSTCGRRMASNKGWRRTSASSARRAAWTTGWSAPAKAVSPRAQWFLRIDRRPGATGIDRRSGQASFGTMLFIGVRLVGPITNGSGDLVRPHRLQHLRLFGLAELADPGTLDDAGLVDEQQGRRAAYADAGKADLRHRRDGDLLGLQILAPNLLVLGKQRRQRDPPVSRGLLHQAAIEGSALAAEVAARAQHQDQRLAGGPIDACDLDLRADRDGARRPRRGEELTF